MERKAKRGWKEGDMIRKWLFLKKCIKDYSAKIDSQFMTKMAEKPYPLGPHIPI